jgi:lysophospholipase L1-like esterase
MSEMNSTRIKREKLILIGLVPIFFIFYLSRTSGVVIFIVLSLILISSLLFVKHLGAFFPYFQRNKTLLNNLLLVVTSVMLSLIVIESFLWIYQSKPETQQKLVMPEEWKKRNVNIPGAFEACYWHNILHVQNKNGMRRIAPFPPKSDHRFRIMIVGDSLTYGYGVREEESYPMQIEAALKKNFNVEVLNLGVNGKQSEGILEVVRKYTPTLQPDLIIYGVCLNDFLPAHVPDYQNNMAYRFPFPEAFKEALSERTHLGRLISDAYNSVLMRLGLRNDFFKDVLKDFRNYQTRFSRDVKDMNHFVLNRGLPPIIAMVLNQYPELYSKGYQLAMAAEQHLTNSGMTVIPTEEFYKRYDKQSMEVSPWEGHPNAEAHKIFADLFTSHLQHRKELEKYRIVK